MGAVLGEELAAMLPSNARPETRMIVSLGILAYNESANIDAMIASLCEQSLFRGAVPEVTHVEVVCVANGCTDDTSARARDALARGLASPPPGMTFHTVVRDVEKGDKCNAWNIYVHEASNPAATYLSLLDADIHFLTPDTLANTVRLLQSDPRALVATDRPVKTLPEAKSSALVRKFSLATSGLGDPGVNAICGQMYLGRSETLRSIWIPPGLPVEDGFIRACVVTKGFLAEEDILRVRRAENASHSFEGETRLGSIIHHHKRMFIGNYINSLLYGYLWNVSPEGGPPLAQLRASCERDPAWVGGLIRSKLATSGRYFMPKALTRKRWTRLSKLGPLGKIKGLPVAFGGYLFDVYVARIAERSLRKGEGLGFW